MLLPASGIADSAASRNRAGNRLFEDGKYSEAEKAYLEAQLKAPGKPELLYNFGNALLKQKKYDPACQSLRQAAGNGSRGLEANAWYNLGNALYETGRFQDAADAYVQALRVNPSDRDAKHNLELALRQRQQKEQQAGGDSSQQKGGEDSKKTEDNREPERAKTGAAPGRAGEQNSAQPPAQQNGKPDTMSREQALQILDALEDQEMSERRRLLQQQRRKATGRDW